MIKNNIHDENIYKFNRKIRNKNSSFACNEAMYFQSED